MPRPDLVARLEAEVAAHRLTVVSAAAGWGKTTLVVDWLAAQDAPTAWVALDDSDNDPARFWRYVSEALGRAGIALDAQAVGALSGADATREVGLTELINAVAVAPRGARCWRSTTSTPSASPSIVDSLAFLVPRLPDSLRLVVTTRSDPPLGLARLRARGDLGELRADDLRFTGPEAARLLGDAIGADLPADEVERLRARTEGWAAGLYLAGLSLRGRDDAAAFIADFAGDDRLVVDYLAAEVLEGQPRERRDFLLRTAILARLTAPLCDAVTGREGSAAVLTELERSNLFLVPARPAPRVVPLPPPLRRAAAPRADAGGAGRGGRAAPPRVAVVRAERRHGRRDPPRGRGGRPGPRRRPHRRLLGRLRAQRLDRHHAALAGAAARGPRPRRPAALPGGGAHRDQPGPGRRRRSRGSTRRSGRRPGRARPATRGRSRATSRRGAPWWRC